MRMVTATYPYWDFIRNLRSHPDVQHGFIQKLKEPLRPINQTEYMSKYWNDFYVSLNDSDEEQGYIGLKQIVDRSDLGRFYADITVCVDPESQGQGIGVQMIEYIYDKYSTGRSYPFAKVLKDNHKSIKAFDRMVNKKFNDRKITKEVSTHFYWYTFEDVNNLNFFNEVVIDTDNDYTDYLEMIND